MKRDIYNKGIQKNMQNKQLKSPLHQSGVPPSQQKAHQLLYGYHNQGPTIQNGLTSSRYSNATGTTQHITTATTRSHDRVPVAPVGEKYTNQEVPQQPGSAFTSANNNYYYSQGGGHELGGYHQTQHNNAANYQTLQKGNNGIKKVVQHAHLNHQNAAAALQAYATLNSTQKQSTVVSHNSQPRKNNSNEQIAAMSPPHHQTSGAGIQLYQQISGSKMSLQNTQTASSSNLNRYESLQSKLKNKRRQQPTNNLLGSNSQTVGGGQQSSVSSGGSLTKKSQPVESNKFNQTQKIGAATFGASTAPITGGSQLTNRKQLKLSLDIHSDSSFNNISIKSADKHNSVARAAAGFLTQKNQKDLSSQISPQSNNGGSAIVNLLASSQSSSVYSSHFSNNSRFTSTRPKNPTDSSSLSSKNSDNLSATGGTFINLINDAKTHIASSNKQATIQTIREQQQLLIQQHQQSSHTKSDSMSDTGEGSFSSNHDNNMQQNVTIKQIGSKNIAPTQHIVAAPVVQLKTSNSITNLSKINQSINFTVQQPHNQIAFKSKFLIAAKPADIKKTGHTPYDVYKSTQKPVVNTCGAPFSPKEKQQQSNLSSKVSGVKQTLQFSQVASTQQLGLATATNQRNNGGFTLKSTGSISGESRGSVGLTTQAKKSSRDKLQHVGHQILSHQPHIITSGDQKILAKPQASELHGISQHHHGLQQYHPSNNQQFNPRIEQSRKIATMPSETIHEERFEDSEQNTKRDSTSKPMSLVGGKKLSTVNLHQYNEQQQTLPQKSKSLMTINIEQQESIKRANEQAHIAKVGHGGMITQIDQSEEAAPPQSRVEEIKSNPTLQALKEQLKSQIAKQHHVFSNPNQPSSQIEVEDIQYPITPLKALKLFTNNLTEYERTEILECSEIYFLGLNAPKIKGSPQLQHNLGYDDDRGDYSVVIKDHLCYRYEVLDFLGKGSFGQAVKCFDYKTNQLVAVKIIRNKKRFHHQAGVELNILSYLRDNDPDDVNNIIRIKEYAVFRKHLIITFELLSINLYEFIKNNNFQGVSLGLIRRFAIQILQALKYQRDHGVIHCDLKPENILLKQPNKSGIKIIDYGSSCFQNQRIYTYIQSRFYRAPEIVLGVPYTTSIDMWSFGCILAELYTGFPLFPGENEMEQLAYIMEIKGIPEDYILELSSRKKLFFDGENQPIIVANSRGKKRRPLTKTLKGVLKCTDVNFLSFLDSLLDWDPVNRMTPLEALQHDWILEGLPPKVLLHHQRMFGHKEDKTNIKEATLTQIQGFPPDAESNSIFNLLKKKKSLISMKNPEGQLKQSNGRNESNTPNEQFSNDLTHTKGHTPQQILAAFSQPSQASQNSMNSQPKKNKTIQHFVQELIQEKRNDPKILHHQAPNEVVHKQVYLNQMDSLKNQTMTLHKMKELDHNNASGPATLDVADDDIEEGVNFNKTQKIPISMIKQQQDKISVHQVAPPFYNPSHNGPKFNNYVSQAAAFNKKVHSSTTNLNARYQNYSVTVGTLNDNNSLNHNNTNACSISNLNVVPAYQHASTNERGMIHPSAGQIKGTHAPSSANLVQASIAHLQQKNNQLSQRTKQAFKIDLSSSASETQIQEGMTSRR